VLQSCFEPHPRIDEPIDEVDNQIEALIASDYAPVQGFVLMMALLYVLLNLVIDLVYGLVDPRVRLEA
jgi:ABC-type dipeptide/oligopeptide/nickel transport system permease component